MEAAAYDYFRRIDELGGMVEAVKMNFPQREIADAAYELQGEIDDGKRIVVGVNSYKHDDDETKILKIDAALEQKQLDRLQSSRARRDATKVEASLVALKEVAAKPEVNVMPSLLECARANASEGEIVAALQEVFGSYTETPIF
jgi:methylmalonyl-CoA mutase N-terminal domain/subunit